MESSKKLWNHWSGPKKNPVVEEIEEKPKPIIRKNYKRKTTIKKI